MNQVRWVKYQGPMDEAECQRVRGQPIYQIGDTVLVWVNEGDILALGQNMDTPEPSPEEEADMIDKPGSAIHGKP